MSWAEIKKAINSDLSTPLNVIINTIKNLIGNANPTVETTSTLFGYLKRLDNITSVPFVKSIQRGSVPEAGDTLGGNTRTINISPVNPAKSLLIISSDTPVAPENAYSPMNNSQKFTLGVNTITQEYSMTYTNAGGGLAIKHFCPFYWQVIEFS